MSATSDLEQKLGHVFADRALLDRALSHASLPGDGENNERLEFLGDRVLGLAVAAMLFEAYPAEDEGKLARRHTALVQQAALDDVAAELSLHDHVRAAANAAQPRGDAILSDAVEALIGAVYIDAGYDAAAAVVRRLWAARLSKYETPPQDPKTELQEWAQAKGLPLPQYRIVSRAGPDHAPQFRVEVVLQGCGTAEAEAPSRRAGEKAAAEKLLKQVTGS